MYLPHNDNIDWFNTVVRSLNETGIRSPFGEVLPAFPDEALQAGTTGLSGEAAVRQAFAFYEDAIAAVPPAKIYQTWKVLDFGSCWGRITRLFMRHVPIRNVTGIDVDPDFVRIARELFPGGQFETCSPLPPTTLEANSFNLVTAYSVFSHLSEEAALAWIKEFARVMAPGGFLAFTTRHVSFLDYCQWLRNQPDLSGYQEGLASMFENFDEARSRYRSGEFLFSLARGVAGSGTRGGGFYGEAFIPTAYVEANYAPWFDVVSAKFDPARYDQMCFVLKRKNHE